MGYTDTADCNSQGHVGPGEGPQGRSQGASLEGTGGFLAAAAFAGQGNRASHCSRTCVSHACPSGVLPIALVALVLSQMCSGIGHWCVLRLAAVVYKPTWIVLFERR